ncbi:MAG TPA: hypothetical protein VFM50_12030 [Nocardioidaceae bacterium]|nr:hypothetical protein [Nocardioidaceae bacterium]
MRRIQRNTWISLDVMQFHGRPTISLGSETFDGHGDDGTCVNLVAKGQYYGRTKWMRVKVCNSRRENCKVDKGYFDYYAGPVYYSAHCVWARVKMNDGYGNTIMDLWVPFGCN